MRDIKFLIKANVFLYDIKILSKYFSILKLEKVKVISLLIINVFYLLLGLFNPILSGYFFTSLLKKDLSLLTNIILVTVILNIATVGLAWIKSQVSYKLNGNVLHRLRVQIYQSMIRMPINSFDKNSSGKYVAIFSNDVVQLCSLITDKTISVFLDILTSAVILIIIFKVNFILGIIVSFFSPVSYILFIFYGATIKQKTSIYKVQSDKFLSEIQQSIRGIKDIKSLGIIDFMIKDICFHSKELIISKNNISKLSIESQMALSLIACLQNLIIMVLGSYFVFQSTMKVELLIAFMSYSQRFTNSLINLSSINTDVQQAIVAAKRIEGISNLKENDSLLMLMDAFPRRNVVEMKNVSFKYFGEISVLTNINISFKENSINTIVGRSGVGKTTIFNLIAKLNQPTIGEILIDGVNVDDFSESIFRSMVTIVNQEPYLFNKSIKENLRIANPLVSDEALYQCCEMANIHHFITSLPEGYNTIIEEGGKSLSVGQKQRIAIARALLKKPRIILLDEVTSALDTEAQDMIIQTIKKITEFTTVIMIDHRLRHLDDESNIIFLENGNKCIVGKHCELLELKTYRTMISQLEKEIN